MTALSILYSVTFAKRPRSIRVTLVYSKHMKNILLLGLVLVIAASGYYFFNKEQSAPIKTVETPETTDSVTPAETLPEGRVMAPAESTDTPAPAGKLKAANFSGKLEEVNVGCFADGECYVVVGGKHITTMMGWSRDIWGTVQGVPSFGDLEGQIGKDVEVYVQDLSNDTYTLKGSEGFYIKLK